MVLKAGYINKGMLREVPLPFIPSIFFTLIPRTSLKLSNLSNMCFFLPAFLFTQGTSTCI